MSFSSPPTSSMDVQARSVSSPTEQGSVQNLTRTASVAGTSNSQQHSSDTTSETTHSESEHNDHVITRLGDRHAIQYFPTTMHYSLQHISIYQCLSTYPTGLQHEELHSASPESLFHPTNPNTQTHHRSTNQPVQLLPQTLRECHDHASTSFTKNNSTDQDGGQYQQSLPISFPPVPSPPASQCSRSTNATISSDKPQSLNPMQYWLGAHLTGERMQVGHRRWENEEEGRAILQEQIHDRLL